MAVPEFKSVKADFVSNVDTGIVEGYASTFDNVDHGLDVVRPGAFKSTLDARLKSNLMKVKYNHYDTIGKPLAAYEDSKGLYTKSQISQTSLGRDVTIMIKDGVIGHMSFGYIAKKVGKVEIEGKSVRELWEVDVPEYSMVDLPMNDLSEIMGAKGYNALADAVLRMETRLDEMLAEKHVSNFSDLQVADKDAEWNPVDAENRVKSWAGDDKEKYSKAFMWSDQKGSHKHIYADVIDGELKAIPRALFKVASDLEGSTATIETSKIKEHTEKYYHKMGIEAPWKKSLIEVASVKDLQCLINTLEKVTSEIKGALDTPENKVKAVLEELLHKTKD